MLSRHGFFATVSPCPVMLNCLTPFSSSSTLVREHEDVSDVSHLEEESAQFSEFSEGATASARIAVSSVTDGSFRPCKSNPSLYLSVLLYGLRCPCKPGSGYQEKLQLVYGSSESRASVRFDTWLRSRRFSLGWLTSNRKCG